MSLKVLATFVAVVALGCASAQAHGGFRGASHPMFGMHQMRPMGHPMFRMQQRPTVMPHMMGRSFVHPMMRPNVIQPRMQSGFARVPTRSFSRPTYRAMPVMPMHAFRQRPFRGERWSGGSAFGRRVVPSGIGGGTVGYGRHSVRFFNRYRREWVEGMFFSLPVGGMMLECPLDVWGSMVYVQYDGAWIAVDAAYYEMYRANGHFSSLKWS
ncbi:MAG: hypothetical protein ACREGH_04285, partial [Minisyncoccia bacterium]